MPDVIMIRFSVQWSEKVASFCNLNLTRQRISLRSNKQCLLIRRSLFRTGWARLWLSLSHLWCFSSLISVVSIVYLVAYSSLEDAKWTVEKVSTKNDATLNLFIFSSQPPLAIDLSPCFVYWSVHKQAPMQYCRNYEFKLAFLALWCTKEQHRLCSLFVIRKKSSCSAEVFSSVSWTKWHAHFAYSVEVDHHTFLNRSIYQHHLCMSK